MLLEHLTSDQNNKTIKAALPSGSSDGNIFNWNCVWNKLPPWCHHNLLPFYFYKLPPDEPLGEIVDCFNLFRSYEYASKQMFENAKKKYSILQQKRAEKNASLQETLQRYVRDRYVKQYVDKQNMAACSSVINHNCIMCCLIFQNSRECSIMFIRSNYKALEATIKL